VQSNPHEGWRSFLPYYIAKYKGEAFTIATDQMQYWYRDTPSSGGSTGGVVGNNGNHGQSELPPSTVCQDKIFYSALLKEDADVYVSIGDNRPTVQRGSKGLNHWSRGFEGQTGEVRFSVVRGGKKVKESEGTREIKSRTRLANGMTNWNAWVGSF
jgi:glucan endo-1,3-alpha-glucosidase